MTIFNHYASDSLPSLIDSINRYTEAGIDPAFDADMDELERHFAELRLTFGHN